MGSAAATLMRYENAAARIHREMQHRRYAIQDLLDARFQLALCDCGKRVGGYDKLRCEFCGTWTRHCVEMQITPASAAALTLGAL